MSLYALQKLIRDVNRTPALRQRFFGVPESLLADYDLSDTERSALMRRDYGALYRMGVHGLLLRPFSILHSVAEKDYLAAIHGEVD